MMVISPIINLTRKLRKVVSTSQEEVYGLLKSCPDQRFTSVIIAKMLGLNRGSVSNNLKRLRKMNTINHKMLNHNTRVYWYHKEVEI